MLADAPKLKKNKEAPKTISTDEELENFFGAEIQ